jgi:hypothetical protein
MYAPAVRASPWFLAALIAGCHPSASVEHTMPVANLQSYRTVALRVKSTAFASQGQAMSLEAAVLQKLQQTCGFSQVGPVGATPADVVLDLNITNTSRGGGGLISNSSQARIDTLLVLTDGQNGDLLGTARIHGKSSGMIINGAPPENEAIDIVAKTVADVLAKSGCTGPRIARVEEPKPPVTGPGVGSGSAAAGSDNPGPVGLGSPVGPDETHRAEADALNEQGKDKLRGADLPGAQAAFQQANALVPDPRYVFNLCLVYETQEQWDKAIASCRQARAMNPQPNLVTKIDHRLDLLQHRQ